MNAKILVVKPFEPMRVEDVDSRFLNSLDWTKRKLGGWPERVRLERTERGDRLLGLIVDGDGYPKGLPRNVRMFYPDGTPYPIAGPVLVVAFERIPQDELVCGLTDAERERWTISEPDVDGIRDLRFER
jgi:hypothetical protein